MKILVIESRKQVLDQVLHLFQNSAHVGSGAATGRMGLDFILRDKPDLVLLSDEIADVRPGDLLKAMRLKEELRSMPVVVMTADTNMRKLKALMACGANDYLPRGFNLAMVEKKLTLLCKQSAPAETATPAAGGGEAKTCNNSLLPKKLICPVHEDDNLFESYALRARTQVTEQNFFDITMYKGAAPNYDPCNYTLQEVHVCPTCFFASSDIRQFVQVGETKPGKEIFSPKAREVLLEALQTRERTTNYVDPEALFSPLREYDEAIASFDLAIQSSKTLYEFAPSDYAIEHYKMANYMLKKAQLAAEEHDLRYEDIWMQSAYKIFPVAFTEITGPNFFKLAYQFVALGVFYNHDDQVLPYFTQLRKLKAGASLESPAVCERYFQKTKEIWENRKYHRKDG